MEENQSTDLSANSVSENSPSLSLIIKSWWSLQNSDIKHFFWLDSSITHFQKRIKSPQQEKKLGVRNKNRNYFRAALGSLCGRVGALLSCAQLPLEETGIASSCSWRLALPQNYLRPLSKEYLTKQNFWEFLSVFFRYNQAHLTRVFSVPLLSVKKRFVLTEQQKLSKTANKKMIR